VAKSNNARAGDRRDQDCQNSWDYGRRAAANQRANGLEHQSSSTIRREAGMLAQRHREEGAEVGSAGGHWRPEKDNRTDESP
jgi:hypothetical protein